MFKIGDEVIIVGEFWRHPNLVDQGKEGTAFIGKKGIISEFPSSSWHGVKILGADFDTHIDGIGRA